jgi:hypothetical protein
MWYPEDVERIEGLAWLIDRWVQVRRRARLSTTPPSRGSCDDSEASTRDLVDHAPGCGGAGAEGARNAAAAPSSSGGPDRAALAAYRRWCVECAGVTEAYGNWADSSAAEEADAWRAYELALDRAETAYILYVQVNERAPSCET